MQTKSIKRQNRTKDSQSAVDAVNTTLNGINFSRYSERVVKSVAAQAEVYDRIRARSLAAAPRFVLR